MKIDHLAIWTNHLEEMKDFYTKFFKMTSKEKYYNASKEFSSYFLAYENGARIELMHKPGIRVLQEKLVTELGLAHFAISLGNKKAVDELTENIRSNGFKVIGEPRVSGNGYYESIIADPEGNLVEITE